MFSDLPAPSTEGGEGAPLGFDPFGLNEPLKQQPAPLLTPQLAPNTDDGKFNITMTYLYNALSAPPFGLNKRLKQQYAPLLSLLLFYEN